MHWGPFRVGQVALDLFPKHLWSALVSRRCRGINAEPLHYGDSHGYTRRSGGAIANYLNIARSVRCEAGTSHDRQWLPASARDFSSCSVEPGGSCVGGGSELPASSRCLHNHRMSSRARACRFGRARCSRPGSRNTAKRGPHSSTPSHQFPLGVTMSASRRLRLVEWAQHSGAWIIEDDYDSEFRYESLPIASLQGLDANSRVIYIGTFSKVLFPSLRLGYIVIPPDLVDRFLADAPGHGSWCANLYQEVLADFIREGILPATSAGCAFTTASERMCC